VTVTPLATKARDATAPSGPLTSTALDARRQSKASARAIVTEVVVGIGVCAWAWWVAVPARVDALPSIFAEIAILTVAVIALTLRDPLGTLRISNPALSMVGWMYYYFIKPAFTWLEGNRLVFESPSTVVLDVSIVTEVQVLHSYYMVAFFAAYLVVAPRATVKPIFTREALPSIKVAGLVLLGLAPYLSTFVERIVTTGTFMPTSNYGDNMVRDTDALLSSRTEGGAGYLVTQIFSKVWYFPLMAMGLGYGVLISRMMIKRRWLHLALFGAQVPLLLLLGSGSRSYTVYPFLLAFMIADAFSGPYRWWRATPALALVMQGFDFYGFYRGHQHEGLRAGFDASVRDIDATLDVVQSEDAAMLTKEAYCTLVVNHGREHRGIGYFGDQLLQLVPAQLAPEKLQTVNTADFLSNELIGYGRYASGAAGAMVGDGYLLAGTLGVILLAGVLGLTYGLVVRWGMSGERGKPTMWRYLLMLMISVQSTQYIRADYSVVLIQLLYYVVVPAVLLRVLEESRFLTNSVWTQRLDTIEPAR
jgi:hypothetical protein